MESNERKTHLGARANWSDKENLTKEKVKDTAANANQSQLTRAHLAEDIVDVEHGTAPANPGRTEATYVNPPESKTPPTQAALKLGRFINRIVSDMIIDTSSRMVQEHRSTNKNPSRHGLKTPNHPTNRGYKGRAQKTKSQRPCKTGWTRGQ